MPKHWWDPYYDVRLSHSTSTVSDRVWYKWLTTSTPLYSLERDTAIWNNWTKSTNHTTSYSMEPVWVSWQVNHAIENQAHRRRIAEFNEGQRERRQLQTERRQIARNRARDLCLRHLSERQRATVEQHGYFDITSQLGRRYRIYTDRGTMHNVFLIDAVGENHLYELCAYTPGVPDWDNFMAQKLYLETNEEGFLRAANIWVRADGRTGTSSHEGHAFDYPRWAKERSLVGPAPVLLRAA